MKHIFVLIMIIAAPWLFSQTNHRDSIDVLNYTINLDLSRTETRQIYGKTELKLVSLFTTDIIRLDLEGLITDSVFYRQKKAGFVHNSSILSLPLDQKITTNDTVTITVYYHGYPLKDKEWGGFFIEPDYAFNFGIGMHSSPPNFGRCWFPCIDNFTDRAYYEYIILTKSNHFAACPGILQSTSFQKDGKKQYHWKLNQPIPTYLSTVAVADYVIQKDSVRGMERNIPIEIYIDRGQEKTVVQTFKHVKYFLSAFENRYGPYLWDKIGYVSTPFCGGAMEHATCISYSAYCNQTEECEGTLAHELSHHWFGNLVTCASEKDMWLNEGWASYSEAIFYEYKAGEKAYKKQIRENHYQVLTEAVNNPEGFGAIYGMPHSETYGSIVYNKGADVVHTLRGQLGDSIFFNAVREYLKTYAFQSISVYKFQDFLINQTKTDLTDFFDFWVYSAGFPHYAINNVSISKMKNKYIVDFDIDQQFVNTQKYLNNCRIEVGFLDTSLNIKKTSLLQNGKSKHYSIDLDFKPKLVLIDPDEKISDATTDEYEIVHKPGETLFLAENFILNIHQYTKPIFYRVVCNWISPVSETGKANPFKLNNKYWELEFYCNDKYNSTGKFFADKRIDLDKTLANTDIKNIVLLYRPNIRSEWKLTDAKFSEQDNFLVAEIQNPLNGQYTMAIKK